MGQADETTDFGGQEVKGQGHTTPKLGLAEASFSTSLGRVGFLAVAFAEYFS